VRKENIQVELNERSYSITIGAGVLSGIGSRIRSLENVSKIFLITDENVEPHYLVKVAESLCAVDFEPEVAILPPGEETKCLEYAGGLWETLLDIGADRKSVVIALGGGVIGDLSGFVAATYTRGIRFFQIPTTLLAQVDSSVGGKVAIDLPEAKNMVGAFHQPVGVLIDPETLKTLPEAEYRAGLGEVVKYGVSLDAGFFEFLEQNVDAINERQDDVLTGLIAQCCRIKAGIVSQDEKETLGIREYLNYGHTFGHAIESAAGFGTILHGEAVSLGMLYSARLAQRLAENGIAVFRKIDEDFYQRQKLLMKRLRLFTEKADVLKRNPDFSLARLAGERLIPLMKHDKKMAHGVYRFVLPTELGKCRAYELDSMTVLESVLLGEL